MLDSHRRVTNCDGVLRHMQQGKMLPKKPVDHSRAYKIAVLTDFDLLLISRAVYVVL